MRRRAMAVLGLAMSWLGSALPSAHAQIPGLGVGTTTSAPAGTVPGASGSPAANPLANPFTNPYMNPYLNPYLMTTLPADRTDTLLYFMAAQQARGGIGSTTLPGGARQGQALPQAPGARVAGRVAPSRPKPNSRVAGRFDDNPNFNDGRGRLASRFPAYGSVATDAETGGIVSPGLSPAPNHMSVRYFNRQPTYNGNNGH